MLALYKREMLTADANLSPEGSGLAGIGLAHNVAARELVDAALEAAVHVGGTLLKPGTETEWGGHTGYFADPDGFLWEIAWNPEFPLREDGQSTCHSGSLSVASGASRSRPNRLADSPTSLDLHNRRARVSHPALQLMLYLSFVRGKGHTLWLEGSHPFCEVLSLSATGGPPFATIGKEGRGTPPAYYASDFPMSSTLPLFCLIARAATSATPDQSRAALLM
jgi:hypothetical protein